MHYVQYREKPDSLMMMTTMNEATHDHTRFKMLIEYDGTDFVGWQAQSKGRSVQCVIEEALHRVFGQQLRLHGAGRTDAGVHASGQTAHFDIRTRLDPYTIMRALNAHLAGDVTIRQVEIVDNDFHARFSASSREYTYTIAHDRISLERRTRWALYTPIDHRPILEAVMLLEGTHDFTAFSKHVRSLSHHYCHVFNAVWESGEGTSRFTIRANRFLQGMVRCLIGGLVLVGRGKLTPDAFSGILQSCDRARAPMLAPSHGLVLTAVKYDSAERAIVDEIMRQLRSGEAMHCEGVDE